MLEGTVEIGTVFNIKTRATPLQGYDRTKSVPKGFYATHSADVRITSFRTFNRIMYPLRVNY